MLSYEIFTNHSQQIAENGWCATINPSIHFLVKYAIHNNVYNQCVDKIVDEFAQTLWVVLANHGDNGTNYHVLWQAKRKITS
ncbi:hypothetical protein CCR75_004991 [Bremia lactucae]|uniref:Uncharacterized protein n=1 Tax=Bremia lactucae TaxID=4779 RepID=A0A976FQ18_BRELC|nr:hypothetical protein CCR75_004991 [Bremia lactucae]